jgi:hypothetical protein
MSLQKTKEWTYDDLQDAWCEMVDLARLTSFAFYETVSDRRENWYVRAPDISSDEPVIKGTATITIKDEDESSVKIKNPTWGDIANFFTANYATCPFLKEITQQGKHIQLIPGTPSSS